MAERIRVAVVGAGRYARMALLPALQARAESRSWRSSIRTRLPVRPRGAWLRRRWPPLAWSAPEPLPSPPAKTRFSPTNWWIGSTAFVTSRPWPDLTPVQTCHVRIRLTVICLDNNLGKSGGHACPTRVVPPRTIRASSTTSGTASALASSSQAIPSPRKSRSPRNSESAE